jgi:putative peptidoglycan binding protein
VIAFGTALVGPRASSAWLWPVETAVTIALASASWRYIETPIMRNGLGFTARHWVQLVAAACRLHLRPGRESGPAHQPAQTVNPAQPSTPASPAVTPSASVKKLQQELGQLNYYEGPVDGVMGPQTVAAIKDLQRQADLPQTGTMNAATQKALDNYLAHGNNQMGGNS